MTDVTRIAVVHARGLGDLIFALPALEALRHAYPRAEITVLGNSWYAPFWADRPGPVDRVVVVPPGVGLPEVKGRLADGPGGDGFFAAQAALRYDLAVQLHGGGRNSNPFTRRLGAQFAVGARTPDAPPLDRYVPYRLYQHEVLRCLEVVGLVGAAPARLAPLLTVSPHDLREAAAVAPISTAPLVALHPGAGDSRRRWPPERFAALADALADAGATVAVTGTRDERDVVDAVCAAARAPIIDTCGRLSLGGLAGLLSCCALVVSNDSGPLHLAAAVGASTVGLYWCGNVLNAGPFTREWHRAGISWQMACPLCGAVCTRDDCGHDASFLLDLDVEEVRAEVLDLLSAVISRGRAPTRRPASSRR